MKISKRFLDRAKPALRKYQKVLASAHARDVNESDTVVIVSDFLTEVLGYDKYEEITTELAIRSSFCDLAVKRDGRVQYLIEVKAIGTPLRDTHLSQAISYGAREGIEWVFLTNGVEWQAHRLRFEQPIEADAVFAVNLLDESVKPAHLLEKLYLVSREAASAQLDQYWRQKEATSRYVLAQLLLNDPVIRAIRRELSRLFKGIKVTDAEIAALLRNEVLKRDALEGDRADAADKLVRRAARRRQRARESTEESDSAKAPTDAVAVPHSIPAKPHPTA